MNSINIKYHLDYALADESSSSPSHFPVKLISSENLFEAGKEVLIQHRGEQYHLRLTRNDKLILTK
ncbi:MAG: hemin uptake protein HemP [Nitrosomonas sp.]|uniref:hemin uptake protein HemP n=1 Tax=Nitrosomonas sp. TaxID=42353 RepID=UPI002565EA6F|nr:hemin uptake protein HemP [Nitrosomonas sp.]MBE7527666.1 hemin uptake protein HemP [Burkholderiales bacterium]MCC6161215.1 hemin uptake protein HemP [Nitrosomonas sp.]MDL1866624.1 hemin uptake protein HemP [Betaproteobacteria bacterium PRO4]